MECKTSIDWVVLRGLYLDRENIPFTTYTIQNIGGLCWYGGQIIDVYSVS